MDRASYKKLVLSHYEQIGRFIAKAIFEKWTLNSSMPPFLFKLILNE